MNITDQNVNVATAKMSRKQLGIAIQIYSSPSKCQPTTKKKNKLSDEKLRYFTTLGLPGRPGRLINCIFDFPQFKQL